MTSESESLREDYNKEVVSGSVDIKVVKPALLGNPTTTSFDGYNRVYSSSVLARQMYTEPFQLDPNVGLSHNDVTESTLTDFYQLTMAYGYWCAGKTKDHAVFDVFFRKCPFKGEYAIVAGIEEVIRFINTWRFTTAQLEYIQSNMPTAPPEFFTYLASLDCSEIDVYALREGEICFPKVPVMRIEGPLIICQLLETTVLNLLNYPCLVATNAARHCLAAGPDKEILEFGCRRAQGPDGAMSASRYTYLGGVAATSNVKAGHIFGIPIRGTHAHAFVSSFSGLNDLQDRQGLGDCSDFVSRVLKWRNNLGYNNTNDGELAAFISYAQAFPDSFLALVDTYETLQTGVPNFLCVAFALEDIGYKAIGIRLDSGDLAYLSKETRRIFREAAAQWGRPGVEKYRIVASNDISEQILLSLKEQRHEIDTFGIGTNLVTCQSQPALGMVYKLVELNQQPRIKISQDVEKTTIPARKSVYRLFSNTGEPLLDLMTFADEEPPKVGERIFCRHVFDVSKRCYVVPARVESLMRHVWSGGKCPIYPRPTLSESRDLAAATLKSLRVDHLRPANPTPYKVSVSAKFYDFFRDLWQETAPIKELR